MIPLNVTLDLDASPWEDIDHRTTLPRVGLATVERVGILPRGTESGRSTVVLLVRMPDGRPVLAETTLRLFNAAARAVAASPIAEAEAD